MEPAEQEPDALYGRGPRTVMSAWSSSEPPMLSTLSSFRAGETPHDRARARRDRLIVEHRAKITASVVPRKRGGDRNARPAVKMAALKRCALFKGLKPEQLAKLAATAARVEEHPPGATLPLGDGTLYVLLAGSVRVSRTPPTAS